MATYNGADYLEDQINSIISQSYAHWQLIIHDDGSIDNTLAIIKKFTAKDSRIRLIEDGVTGLGCAHNFLHLLSFSTAPFIMFCDQDDLWLEKKVETLLHLIKSCNNKIPQAYYAEAYPWSPEDKKLSGKTFLCQPKTINELLFLNAGIQGASSIFNAKTRDIMRKPVSYCAMHDHLLSLCVLSFGEAHYTSDYLMLYRQHNNNVTGKTDKNFWRKIKRQLFQAKPPVINKPHYKAVASFFSIFTKDLSRSNKILFQAYLQMPSVPLLKKIQYTTKYQFKIYGSTLLLLLKIVTRRYISASTNTQTHDS